ncbi:MAG: hypothetical protein ACI8TQ_002058 [Planctomycetota bacterium]|jgi:hypothetical protein
MAEEQITSDMGEGSGELAGWRRLLLLLVAPIMLIGPSLLPGRRFLPQLPVQYPPLSTENPEAAQASSVGANHSTSDRILPFLTEQIEISRQVRQGNLPTWDPKLGMGLPLFAGSLVSPAYPPNWLAIFLPPDLAAGWLALFCLFIGGAGIFALAKRRGLSSGAAAVGAIAFQTAGWALTNLHLPMKVDAAVWLPWCLWAVQGLVQERRYAGLWLFLFTACSFLAGFAPIAFFCAVLVFCISTWQLFSDRHSELAARRPLKVGLQVAGFLALGALGAGVQLLPSQEASLLSVRQDQTAERVEAQALPMSAAFSLLIPDMFGSPEQFQSGPHPAAVWLSSEDDRDQLLNFNSLEWNAFAGISVLALAIVALIATPRRAAFPFCLWVAAWGFAQGWPVMRFFYHLPGFDLVAPGRVLAVQWFVAPWLAALGTQVIIDRRPRAIATLLVMAFSITACAFLFWTGFDPAGWSTEFIAVASERFGVAPELVALQFSDGQRLAAGEELLVNSVRVLGASGALFAAGLCALLLRRSPAAFGAGPPPWKLLFALLITLVLFLIPVAVTQPERVLLPLVLGLAYALVVARPGSSLTLAGWLPFALVVAIEGGSNGAAHLQPRQVTGELFPASPAIAVIETATGDGRVLRLDQSPGETPEDVVSLARPGLLEPYGLSDLTPYTVFTPRTLVELFGSLGPGTTYSSGISSIPSVELIDHPILDLARVTCLLSRKAIEHARLIPVFESSGFNVYQRTGVPPVVHVVREAIETQSDEEALALLSSGRFDPARQIVLAPGLAAVSEYKIGHGARESLTTSRVAPHRLDVSIESTAGGWLVFHEQYYPGWKATIDGVDAEILRVNHAQRALPIPAGKHVVRTKYEPWSLRFGTTLTLLAFICAAWLSKKLGRSTPHASPE